MPPYSDDDGRPTRSHGRRYSRSTSTEPYKRRSRSNDRRRSRKSEDSRSYLNPDRRRHVSGDREQSRRNGESRSLDRSRRHDTKDGDHRKDYDPRHQDYDDGRPPKRRRSRSPSRSPRPGKAPRSISPRPLKRAAGPLPSQKDAFTSIDITAVKTTPPLEKQKPNFAPTGRLAAESNTVKSASGAAIILKYHEPPESRKPSAAHQWRMYVFKESQILDTVLLHERSCWLIGREAAVVDYLVEHPSTSKQHAVIQFRYVEKRNEFGDKTGKVRPYVIDLESANGTKVNGDIVPAGRYLELRDGDVVTFGESTRDYVVQLPPPDD
jgi:smad nuclear-interacting protein 1